MLNLLGRLHILILHFPIGILLLGIGFEWLHFLGYKKTPTHLRSLIFGIGSIAALGSSLSGYLLSTSGNYNYNLVMDHQWAGIITTILAFITWSLVAKEKNNLSPWIGLLLAVCISYTGHLGGLLTHGVDFLKVQSKEEISDTPIFTITDIPSAIVYKDVIDPILQAKCVSCHGPNKQKGKLRLDTYNGLLKGGKSDLALLSNFHEQSELIHRLGLPMSSDEHMPPKDKRQLTKEETIIIKKWISEGYNKSHTVAQLENDVDNVALVQQLIWASMSTDIQHQGATIPAKTPDVEIESPSQEPINTLRNMGVVVLPAGIESSFLELNFINVKTLQGDHWQVLMDIAPNILRLKLSDLNVTDEELSHIAKMPHLTSLHINNTDISDQGLSTLQDLQYLTYINVNNTAISNAGIENLNDIESLSTIYAYQTEVRSAELNTSKTVETGNYELDFYPSDTIIIPLY